jgi:uncharacterized membrane protein
MSTARAIPATTSDLGTGTRTRLDSIDVLRGLVMVIMAIDHVRDYFSNSQVNPMDIAHTWPALFFTRWITHFCAPVFVFLAGTGAYLYGSRGRTRQQLAHFLWTRGLWLVFLELTFLPLAWGFSWKPDRFALIVIWAIGWSMILLSAAIRLPVRTVGAIGLGIILLHDAWSGVQANAFGPLGWLWTVLFGVGVIPLGSGGMVLVAYAIIPWFGVMAAGYAAGALFDWELARRRQALRRIGSAAIALFLVLRATNLYGNPRPWSVNADAVRTVFSFLNCEKYPPSLLYLLMTLGPALLLLSYLSDRPRPMLRPLVVFGRVPMFYYVLHIVLLHSVAAFLAVQKFGSAPWMFVGIPFTFPGTEPNPAWGYNLVGVYLFWIAIVASLYPACVWFARLKERRKDPWLSYL